MPHLVVAPDKFRGTASAGEAAAAAAGAARRAGWTADEVPMSDGGEGLLQAVGGRSRHTTVSGPLGQPVDAEWRLLTDGSRILATRWHDTLSVLRTEDGVVVASEPYDDDPRWSDVPDHHLVDIRAGEVTITDLEA